MASYTIASDLNSNNTTDVTDESFITDELSIVPLGKDSFGKSTLHRNVGFSLLLFRFYVLVK